MRCAVDFKEGEPLYNQEIRAWGELQSLNEEPSYKESDIKSEAEKERFKGFKYAFDEVCTILADLVEDGRLDDDASLEIQDWMSGSLCEVLFSILDNEECEDDEDDGK